MELEAAETNFGKFVPLHLLRFTGDPVLQRNFRHLIEVNYGKGIVKLIEGVCQRCGCLLPSNSGIRMKPSHPKTKRITKLLAKHWSGALYGKYSNFAVQRFLKSSTQLTVQCTKCQHTNKQPLLTNEAKMAVREEVVPAEPITKKKKKKKRNKSTIQDNCGLHIPSVDSSPSIEEKSKNLPPPQKTPVQKIEKSFKTPHLNALPKTGLNRTVHASEPRSLSNNSTPSSKKVEQFMTPYSSKHSTPSFKKVQQFMTPFSGKSTGGSALKSSTRPKDLKQLLKEGQDTPKRASLSDFLSSL